ncbi:hypothetical protein ACFL35_21220, partial [Candidatus Riflebacteria bacterium]
MNGYRMRLKKELPISEKGNGIIIYYQVIKIMTIGKLLYLILVLITFLLPCSGKNKNIERGLAILRIAESELNKERKDKRMRANAMAKIASVYYRIGKKEKALALFNKAENLLGPKENASLDNALVWSDIGVMYLDCKLIGRAMACVQTFNRNSLTADRGYSQYNEKLLKLNKIDIVMNNIKRLENDFKNKISNDRLKLALKLIKLNREQEAIKWIKPLTYHKDEFHQLAAINYINRGEIQKANKHKIKIKFDGLRHSPFYCDIEEIKYWFRKGASQKAKNKLDKLKKNTLNDIILYNHKLSALVYTYKYVGLKIDSENLDIQMNHEFEKEMKKEKL